MSAHEQLRQMLDQLMGTGRDGENNRYKVQFTDPRVCKSFLLGCCPHDILASTRMDLGECPKIHDLALRADYEQASKNHDYYYDIDAMEHLQNFIADCDRRTELAKRRLAETQEELSAEVNTKANKVHELGEEIGKKLSKAEQLGAEGNVDESLKLMEEVEEFRKKKQQAELEYRNSMPASSYQQQKLRVCEVCSAYLGIHDNDRRLADHFGGKLHLGFIKIREKLDELKVSVAEKKEKRDAERARRFDDRERERDYERERRFKQGLNSKPGFRGAQEGGGRRRTKSKSRSRSRDKRRKRSHSRERRRRSRSRSHHSRSKSRRSKSHSRRSRSRSRSRRSRSKRRSSSRDRRHKSRDRSEDRKHSRSRERSSRKRDSRSAENNARSPSNRHKDDKGHSGSDD